MDKITSFMRVTKKRRALQDKDAVVAAKGKANAKSTSSTTTTGGGGAAVAKAPVTEAEDAEFVPEFIFKTIKYIRKGEAGRRVSPTLQKVAAYIEAHYVVPRDFETSHKFGPHSGLTYEKRLARAYTQRLLQPQTAAKGDPEPICTTCAALGHEYKTCPDGF